MRIVTCLVDFHDLWLVALAALVCIGGGFVTVELYRRARERSSVQRVGWILMAAIAAGCSVWCTHFIAMLAYRTDIPAQYDPLVTLVSLLIVVGGWALAFAVGAARRGIAAAIGGGVLAGFAISGMHYSGMMAYRIEGVVTWDLAYIAMSVTASMVMGAAFFAAIERGRHVLALGAFILAVTLLHFVGMAAVSVEPFAIDPTAASGVEGLAVAIAGGVLLILGTSVASHLIDSDVNEKNLDLLRRLALSDGLTGLPNRTSFTEYLERELSRARLDRRRLGVLVIDLDRFKQVNDLHGHGAGDAVLLAIAGRITQTLKDGEFVAWMGGDEFALVKRLDTDIEMHDLTDRLEAQLFTPVRVAESDIVVGGSIGVALFPSDADTAARLVANADLAMYRAKRDVAHKTCYYEASMDEVARQRRDLAIDLRNAIERDELELHYQVQTDLMRNEVIGYEALLRWNHPTRGCIPPADFIPLAEETGLILPIGEWVLRQACKEAASWDGADAIAVNLSAVQLADANLPDIVRQVIEETGLAPERLELEITETAIIDNKARALHVLQQIRALGVSIAIDDFGTGYSSLETLRSFPFSRIKLDRSFTNELGGDPQSLAIVRAVIALGRSLDITVLAEGVETEQQLAVLRGEGCMQAQGFLFGFPAAPAVLWPQMRLAAMG